MNNTIFDSETVDLALKGMTDLLLQTNEEVYMIGIQQGGARVADALQQRLESRGCHVERGNLDISFYRDDLDAIGPNPEVRPSHLPFNVSGKGIWLVDDVLYTGRTIRAALGEIFDYGRPARIRLAVLVDRAGRELPIAADCAGLFCEASVNGSVKLVTDGDWRIEQREAAI